MQHTKVNTFCKFLCVLVYWCRLQYSSFHCFQTFVPSFVRLPLFISKSNISPVGGKQSSRTPSNYYNCNGSNMACNVIKERKFLLSNCQPAIFRFRLNVNLNLFKMNRIRSMFNLDSGQNATHNIVFNVCFYIGPIYILLDSYHEYIDRHIL